jgi:tetratricopeptide (TPR) repeat protein
MMVTRALSLQQPWATAICAGVKRVENRSWSNIYRGPVAIHAGSNKAQLNRLLKNSTERVDVAAFPIGAIIGIANLVDVVTMNRDLESDLGACGPYCWLFENPRIFREPIPLKGKLQLFNLASETSEKIAQQVIRPAEITDEMLSFLRSEFAHKDDDDHWQWAEWRLKSYVDLNQFEDALRCAEQLVEIDPRSSFGWGCRGWLRLQLGDLSRVLADYDAAISVNPEDAVVYWWRATFHELERNAEAAARDRQRALEIDPDIEEKVDGKRADMSAAEE